MRKILLIYSLIIIVFTSLTQAQEVTKQEKGFFNITEAGLFLGGNDRRVQVAPTTFVSTFDNVNVRSLRNISGVFLTRRISLGLGIGFDGIQVQKGPFYNTFVVFADGRYYFKKDDDGYFAYGDLGSAIPIDNGFQKGLMVNVGGGYKFMISGHTAMNASVGYNEQKIVTSSNVKQRVPSLAFKVGLMF